MTRFKATEWMMRREGKELEPTVTLEILKEMLQKHHKDFLINRTGGWERTDIEHFLNMNHWLYPSHIQEHHIRTCYSILMELSNVDVE